MRDAPLVSVITATYNRSRVVAHAIESVRRSTLADWAVHVVGDACTDDTAEVVARFRDERISFTNLPVNAGEQSAPNNEGLRAAARRFRVVTPARAAAGSGRRPGADRWSCRLNGVPLGDSYDPRLFVFASAWLMTRALSGRVGPWRPARETYVTASQDWLWRAWRAGAVMKVLPRVTALAIPASMRRGYARSGSPEHDYVMRRMADDPGFRQAAFERAALQGERDANAVRFGRAPLAALRGWAFRPAAAAAMAFGVHPHAPFSALRYGRRGNLVSAVRRRSGLDGLG